MLLVGGFTVASCTFPGGTEQQSSPEDLFRAELVDDGTDEDVAECVLRLGKGQIEQESLSEVAADELLVICERSQSDLGSSSSTAADSDSDSDSDSDDGENELALADQPFTFGDDLALDQMWTDCEAGVGIACDQLFDESPVGSEYELFGVSCGEREDIANCVELDDPDVNDDPVPEVYRQWQQAQAEGIDAEG